MSPSKQEKLFPKIYGQELMRIALGDLQAAQLLAAANPDRKENIIYRIVGKYSSHSPSRASEYADGFGWW